MAEPVSLGLTVAQGVVTAIQIGQVTGKWISNTLKAPDQIAQIQRKAQSIEAELRRLYELIEKNTVDIPAADEVGVDDLATVVSIYLLMGQKHQSVKHSLGTFDRNDAIRALSGC